MPKSASVLGKSFSSVYNIATRHTENAAAAATGVVVGGVTQGVLLQKKCRVYIDTCITFPIQEKTRLVEKHAMGVVIWSG